MQVFKWAYLVDDTLILSKALCPFHHILKKQNLSLMFPGSLFPLYSYSRCVEWIQKTCTVTMLELLSLPNLTVKKSTFLDCLLKHSLNQKNKLQKNNIFDLLQRRAEMHLPCSMVRFVPRCL